MSSDPVVLSYGDSILRQSDIEILQGPDWLTDSLIGFYFEYLQNEVFKGNSDVLFVSPEVTQFLKVQQRKEELLLFLGPLEFESKKLICFPLNDCTIVDRAGGSHWSLIIYSKEEQRMYHIDSGYRSNYEHAKRFICNIAKIFTMEFDFQEFSLLKQENSYDCGIFVLYHAKQVSKYYFEHNAIREDVPVNKSEVSVMRADILQLIDSLQNKKKTDET